MIKVWGLGFWNQSHSPLQQKRTKYLGINLPKEKKELYMENYDTNETDGKIFHVLA